MAAKSERSGKPGIPLYLVSGRPARRPVGRPPGRRAPPAAPHKPATRARRNASTMNEPEEPKLLLTLEEAGQRLGFALRTMYNLIEHEGLRTITVGRYRRVPVVALEAWIARKLAAVESLEE